MKAMYVRGGGGCRYLLTFSVVKAMCVRVGAAMLLFVDFFVVNT